MKKIILTICFCLITSLSFGAFSNISDRYTDGETKLLVAKSIDSDINVFKFSTDKIVVKIIVKDKTIIFSGGINTTTDIRSLEKVLNDILVKYNNMSKLEVKTKGYVYTKYSSSGKVVEEETEKFVSLKHRFNHLYWDINECLKNQ